MPTCAPCKLHPALRDASVLKPEVLDGVDLIFVRELTGGIYFGEKKRAPRFSASDLCTYSVPEIERITRVAGRLAMQRGKSRIDRQVQRAGNLAPVARGQRARDQRANIPDVSLEHMLVDSAAMHLLKRPRDFDVLLTENMFGDILTDEGARCSPVRSACSALGVAGREPSRTV